MKCVANGVRNLSGAAVLFRSGGCHDAKGEEHNHNCHRQEMTIQAHRRSSAPFVTSTTRELPHGGGPPFSQKTLQSAQPNEATILDRVAEFTSVGGDSGETT